MKKTLLISLILFGFSNLSIGQSNKLFTAFGQTYVTDYLTSTPTKASFTPNYDDDYGTLEGVVQYKAISYATYLYRVRYNLSEMSDESALSAYVTPTIGLSGNIGSSNTSVAGIGYFSLPIGLSFEKGAGSTYNSSAEKGVSFKLGVEVLFSPLIQSNTTIEVPTGNGYSDFIDGKFKGMGASILPTASIGYRYWNKNNVMREIQFQAGYGGKGAAKGESNESDYNSGMHLQISFFKILNY